MKIPYAKREFKVPENVKLTIENQTIEVTSPLGSLKKSFEGTPLHFELSENTLKIELRNVKKRELSLLGTAEAHVKNMIKGVTQGFTYRLKMVYAHFPMNVKVENGFVKIENFIGERSPRYAKIVGQVNVKVEGDDVIVSGLDKEAVGQTAANIQRATKIKDYDPRVFSDGIFVYSKS
ncbi:50S ribosomal protein L6 [Candidatus Marsarchaeota G2 archaeon ECH_B_SAG-F08]|uniref:Large ribosomal subunit protein uL6 n=1 Tax=Candidatus Marsarchaeota G2 archaeon ECH_B_SAG-F08 TaxID=1978165 RepID=A0A2R6BFW1_9ARCH|nr:MAG: 50S ribosomal protein L6 [Candidatus Marsarchaeota G2 archaeon ECH_B_SAG-F08]